MEFEKESNNVSNTEVRSDKIKAGKYLLDLVIRKPYWPKCAAVKGNTGLQRVGNEWEIRKQRQSFSQQMFIECLLCVRP